eukprot:73841-Chlamydomonas_euryale.AAC.1
MAEISSMLQPKLGCCWCPTFCQKGCHAHPGQQTTARSHPPHYIVAPAHALVDGAPVSMLGHQARRHRARE